MKSSAAPLKKEKQKKKKGTKTYIQLKGNILVGKTCKHLAVLRTESKQNLRSLNATVETSRKKRFHGQPRHSQTNKKKKIKQRSPAQRVHENRDKLTRDARVCVVQVDETDTEKSWRAVVNQSDEKRKNSLRGLEGGTRSSR